MASKTSKSFFFVLCLLVTSFGQPAGSEILSLLASFGGYAAFWRIFNGKNRLFASFAFFFLQQLIQLSWMFHIDYQGFYIFPLLAFLAGGIALQFVFLTWLLPRVSCLFAASIWVLMEYSRLYLLTGFPWNPVGLAMTANLYTAQCAAIFGIYGLGFWVILVNSLLYHAKKWTEFSFAVFLALLSFAYGYFHLQEEVEVFEPISLHVLHTHLSPDEKMPLTSFEDRYVAAYEAWERILLRLSELDTKKDALIVFPESLLPFGRVLTVYPHDEVLELFERSWPLFSKNSYPNLFPPFAQKRLDDRGNEMYYLSNSFFIQAIANELKSEIVLGLDDFDFYPGKEPDVYNAAFLFQPGKKIPFRYEKQILIPGSEYIPFQFVEKIAAKYGISGAFTQGRESKVFSLLNGKKISIAICSEELIPSLLHSGAMSGADIFVTVHNDIWFPNSTLGRQHFDHGRIRAIENGIPMIRSTNGGVSAIVDCFGRVLTSTESKEKIDLFSSDLPHMKVATLYRVWGENPILLLSMVTILLQVLRKVKNDIKA